MAGEVREMAALRGRRRDFRGGVGVGWGGVTGEVFWASDSGRLRLGWSS